MYAYDARASTVYPIPSALDGVAHVCVCGGPRSRDRGGVSGVGRYNCNSTVTVPGRCQRARNNTLQHCVGLLSIHVAALPRQDVQQPTVEAFR